MSIDVKVREKSPEVFVVSPEGSLDSNTYPVLEDEVDALIAAEAPKVIVFDMKGVHYISSMGVRVVLKTKKMQKKHGGKVLLLNLQPQIRKVFEIIRALPSEPICSSMEELDEYLDAMQRKMV